MKTILKLYDGMQKIEILETFFNVGKMEENLIKITECNVNYY